MTLFQNILFVFLLCLGTTQQTVADQLPKALPGGLEELWQGGDRCGEPTLEQWVLTLAMDDSTAALVVDGAKVIPYRFTVEDLIAARSGGPGGTSGSVPPPLEAKAEDGSGGLIYMKARFYDPEIGRFLTQDPAAGDLAVPISLNKYLYAHSNPTAYVDPTGEAAESIWDAASLAVGLASLGYNLYQGNYRDAGLDTLGVLADSAALATPFLPGGAGMAIKGSRAGMATVQQVERARDLTRAVDTVQAVDQTVTVVDSTDRAVDSLDEGHFGEAAFNAGAAMLGARGSVANTGDAWRARRLMEAPTPRGPPQATIVGESAGGPGATLRPTRHGGPDPTAVSSYRPGEFLPDGRIAGHGPGAALRNGPDFGRRFNEQPRDGFGRFLSMSRPGQRIPGTAAVDDFEKQALEYGFEMVGREISVNTPFGRRRYDVALRDPETRQVHGFEIKSSRAAFDRFDQAARQQFAADRWLNQAGGAQALGKYKDREIHRATKLLWELR